MFASKPKVIDLQSVENLLDEFTPPINIKKNITLNDSGLNKQLELTVINNSKNNVSGLENNELNEILEKKIVDNNELPILENRFRGNYINWI